VPPEQPVQDSAICVADPRVPLQEVPLGTLVALPLGLSLPELERFWLLSTLAALEGNRTHCSQKLDIALRTVRNKINEYRADGFEIPSSGHGKED
jgi:DNA-binding NtrC family response regulator